MASRLLRTDCATAGQETTKHNSAEAETPSSDEKHAYGRGKIAGKSAATG